MLKTVCPIFPSRSFAATVAFYERLGFRKVAEFEAEGYLILVCDQVEVHFFRSSDHEPLRSDHGAFVRVDDANRLSQDYAVLGLPTEGVPRVTVAEDKPWGICELAVVDPDGNLLRLGHILE